MSSANAQPKAGANANLNTRFLELPDICLIGRLTVILCCITDEPPGEVRKYVHILLLILNLRYEARSAHRPTYKDPRR
jgi:hypothetical protein